MKGLSRRQILLASLAAAGVGVLDGLFLGQSPAKAQSSASDMHYIFCYLGGGWDILLSLDPRDPAQFTNANMTSTFIQPGYEYLVDPPNNGMPYMSDAGILYGPYIGDLLAFSQKMSVVRGISMETLTHEVGRRRFITGKVPSGLNARGSSGATWLASLLGSEALIPNLSVGVETYNVDQPTFASALRVANQPDLLRVLEPGAVALDGRIETQIEYLLEQSAQGDAALASQTIQVAEANRQQAKFVLESNLGASFDFLANTSQMEALRDHYGFARSTNGVRTIEAQAAMATTAITEGICRCVSVRLANNLDTHNDNWTTDQGPNQMQAFNAIARMAEDLQAREYKKSGKSWLDHTAIVVFSEFSRTAMLNADMGRDHSLTNACLILGGGFKGGKAIGRSSDLGMEPTTTNLQTGLNDPEGEIILPEHIMRTLMVKGGIPDDIADFRVDPLSCLL